MNSLQFGPYVLNPVTRELLRDGSLVVLPSKAFDLLRFMAANPRRPLLKDELMSAVWPDTFVEESNLIQNVSLVRKALAPDGDSLIVTLPRKGYQFTAQVTTMALEAGAIVPALANDSPGVRSRLVYQEQTEERILIRRSPGLMLVLAGGLVLLASVGWLAWERWQDRAGGPPVQVVLADLDGSTGDPVLDRTLGSVFRLELAQSPFVTLVPGATARATLVQMKHKPGDPLTVELARDICERTASQAVLHGTVARIGQRYLLTQEATGCLDGASLGLAKEEVARPEDLPAATSRLGVKIRHSLGESRRTIARFNRPLSPVATGSLEALKDFSQGEYLSQLGRFAEATELMNEAVRLDPGFAAAWLDLANLAVNTMNPAAGKDDLVKAYQFREEATEPTRLYIVARYHTDVTGDLYESLRNYQAWATLYPRSAQPWSGLASVNKELGRPSAQLAAAEQLMRLLPTNIVVYNQLASAQIANGDFKAARATCQAALDRGLDAEVVRYMMLRIGHLTADSALIAAQQSWLDAHPDSPVMLSNMAAFAQQQGQMRESEKLFNRAADAFRSGGSQKSVIRIRQQMALAYQGLGEPERAHAFLNAGAPDPDDSNLLEVLAGMGDTAAATRMLHEQLALHPQSTLWNQLYAPLIQSDLAMRAQKPQEAIAILERTRPFDQAGNDGHYLRGNAYLQANELPQAEAEFRDMIAHPEIEADGYEHPMSPLQLARVLAREGKVPASIEAYQAFLGFWIHADERQPLLVQAKAEMKAVQGAVKQD